MQSVTTTRLPGLECVHRGKVRDLYRVDDDHLLLVATDRFSAFDVVFDQPIPGKGIVLTQLSLYWFAALKGLVEHHVVAHDWDDLPAVVREQGDALRGRVLLVRRVRIEPFECIVRGYLLGSAWADYRAGRAVSGHDLAPGLSLGSPFDPPIFTPSTKAPVGEHDAPVPFGELETTLGEERAKAMRDQSLAVFRRGVECANNAGLVLCDTKLEWGELGGRLVLADEVLTPDSSRYWRTEDLDQAREGAAPPSFDKQVVRDWLADTDWDRSAPGPTIPEDILQTARARYLEIYERLAGKPVPWIDA